MGFLRKNRRCNQCDTRDDGSYSQDSSVKNPLCCHVCGANPVNPDAKPPCKYIAHFGCEITCTNSSGVKRMVAGGFEIGGCSTGLYGDVSLRVRCAFSDPCKFVSRETTDRSSNTDYVNLLEANVCTWDDYFKFIGGTIPPFVVGWTLNIQSATSVTLSYSGSSCPCFATYALPDGVEWDCYGPNTLKKIGASSCVSASNDFPSHVCVTPAEKSNKSYCDRIGQPQTYDTETHRCACCDDYCNCIAGTIRIICGSVAQDASVQYCIGGRTGVQDPVGPSREACTYFNDSSGSPHLICVVIYCVDGGIWKADWYCDGTYDGTVTLASTCCPLTATGNGPPLSCMDCTGCVGVSVDPDCQPPPPPCCYLTSYPNTMTLTMYTGCVGWPATVTLSKAGSTFSGSFLVGGTINTVSISFDATTCLLILTCSDTGSTRSVTMTSVSCDPPTLTGTVAFGILIPFYCGCGFFDTVAMVLG